MTCASTVICDSLIDTHPRQVGLPFRSGTFSADPKRVQGISVCLTCARSCLETRVFRAVAASRAAVLDRVHAFTNGHLNETCPIVIPALQGVDGPGIQSAEQGGALLMLLKDGRVSRAARSLPPGMTCANNQKSRGEIMGEAGSDMKRCKASMLQPCRHANRQGRFRVHPVAVGRPLSSAGVA